MAAALDVAVCPGGGEQACRVAGGAGYSGVHGDAVIHSDAYIHLYTRVGFFADCAETASPYGDADGITYGDGDAYSYLDADLDGNTIANGDQYCNFYTYLDGDADGNVYAHGNANAHLDSQPHAFADALHRLARRVFR